MELVIGNKNYSSWSLRAWFMLRAFDIPFEEKRLALFQEAFYEDIGQYTPAGRVPALVDQSVRVWDSLAICEYINDRYLNGAGWPASYEEKALARSLVCEMHSGFFALRNELPMNCRATRSIELSHEARKDIDRIDQMWRQLRVEHAERGDWLFGELSIVDVFYLPVASRFRSYQVEVSDESQAYIDFILAHPAAQQWIQDSCREPEVITIAEAGEPV